MIALYTELDPLENIATLDIDYQEWNELIKNGVELFVNIDQNSLDAKLNDPDDLITLSLTAYGGMSIPQPSENDFQRFNQDITSALDNPYGIYILDMSEEDCKLAQNNLGLAIYPTSNIPNDFHRLSIDEDFEKDELIQCARGRLLGWHKVLNPFISHHSNSSVIVDRNLFSNEEKRTNVGIHNIKEFLNSCLPSALDITYNLTIITDLSNKIKRKPYRDKLINDLINEINGLRPYDIEVEILFVHSSRSIYPFTHQRRILKNYHYAFSEHGFSLFSVADVRKVRTDNTFKMNHTFEQLIENNQLGGIKLVKKLKKRLSEIKIDAEQKLNDLGQNDYHYRMYLNKDEVQQITNRLLN